MYVSDNGCYHVLVVRLKRHVMLGKQLVSFTGFCYKRFLYGHVDLKIDHMTRRCEEGGKGERTDPYLVNAVL